MIRLCLQARPLQFHLSRPTTAAATAAAHFSTMHLAMHPTAMSKAASVSTCAVPSPAASIVQQSRSRSVWRCAAAAAAAPVETVPRTTAFVPAHYITTSTGIDPGVIPGPPGIDPGTNPGISPRQPGITPPGPGTVPDFDPGTPPGIDPQTAPGGVPDPGVSPGIDPGLPGLDPGRTPGIDPGVISPGDPSRIETTMSASEQPREGTFPADVGSEAVAVDDATIDAIPDSALPAGAARTAGPPGGTRQYSSSNSGSTGRETEGADTTAESSQQPEVNPEAGDPQPDASGPPSGQPGSQVDAEEPLVGKPRTSGPEIRESPASVDDKPEIRESANPDRMPFWGS